MTDISINFPEIGRFSLAWLKRLIHPKPAAAAKVEAIEMDPSTHEIDALFQATFGEGARVVGLIGVETGDGVTTLATALAKRCALTNMRAILVDVSGVHNQDQGKPQKLKSKDGYETLILHPNTGELYQLRTQEFLKKLFSHSLQDYEAVIVKCAPAVARPNDTVPGHVTAACLDTCMLVCMGGKVTRLAIDHAKRALVGVPLKGVIINGRDQPTLGEELAREAMRLSRFFPSLAKSLAARALNSKLFDVRT
jgi:hypothetical protein